ncbi:hypothetical protein PR048_020813 [Dryococelus australis]|uniref:Uncharacterized protein n=1 Tax=Dryococelus australis TaxID=614101 RepID=A0ABQ9GWJ0_9NEOP|nr:hypothetical protein PR048_020813 [Dryococelus australis]
MVAGHFLFDVKIRNYFPSIVINFTRRMSLRAPVKTYAGWSSDFSKQAYDLHGSVSEGKVLTKLLTAYQFIQSDTELLGCRTMEIRTWLSRRVAVEGNEARGRWSSPKLFRIPSQFGMHVSIAKSAGACDVCLYALGWLYYVRLLHASRLQAMAGLPGAMAAIVPMDTSLKGKGLDTRAQQINTKAMEVSLERLRNERAGETGHPRENPPTNGIVRHDSQLRKCGAEFVVTRIPGDGRQTEPPTRKMPADCDTEVLRGFYSRDIVVYSRRGWQLLRRYRDLCVAPYVILVGIQFARPVAKRLRVIVGNIFVREDSDGPVADVLTSAGEIDSSIEDLIGITSEEVVGTVASVDDRAALVEVDAASDVAIIAYEVNGEKPLAGNIHSTLTADLVRADLGMSFQCITLHKLHGTNVKTRSENRHWRQPGSDDAGRGSTLVKVKGRPSSTVLILAFLFWSQKFTSESHESISPALGKKGKFLGKGEIFREIQSILKGGGGKGILKKKGKFQDYGRLAPSSDARRRCAIVAIIILLIVANRAVMLVELLRFGGCGDNIVTRRLRGVSEFVKDQAAAVISSWGRLPRDRGKELRFSTAIAVCSVRGKLHALHSAVPQISSTLHCTLSRRRTLADRCSRTLPLNFNHRLGSNATLRSTFTVINGLRILAQLRVAATQFQERRQYHVLTDCRQNQTGRHCSKLKHSLKGIERSHCPGRVGVDEAAVVPTARQDADVYFQLGLAPCTTCGWIPELRDIDVAQCRDCTSYANALRTLHYYRARWRSSNSLDSHSGGPGFDYRSGHPDFDIPWFSEITPDECWDESLTKTMGDSFPLRRPIHLRFVTIVYAARVGIIPEVVIYLQTMCAVTNSRHDRWMLLREMQRAVGWVKWLFATRSPRIPADQRQRPARFLQAKPGVTSPGIEPGSPRRAPLLPLTTGLFLCVNIAEQAYVAVQVGNCCKIGFFPRLVTDVFVCRVASWICLRANQPILTFYYKYLAYLNETNDICCDKRVLVEVGQAMAITGGAKICDLCVRRGEVGLSVMYLGGGAEASTAYSLQEVLSGVCSEDEDDRKFCQVSAVRMKTTGSSVSEDEDDRKFCQVSAVRMKTTGSSVRCLHEDEDDRKFCQVSAVRMKTTSHAIPSQLERGKLNSYKRYPI